MVPPPSPPLCDGVLRLASRRCAGVRLARVTHGCPMYPLDHQCLSPLPTERQRQETLP